MLRAPALRPDIILLRRPAPSGRNHPPPQRERHFSGRATTGADLLDGVHLSIIAKANEMLLLEMHALEAARRSGSRKTYVEVSLMIQDVIEQHVARLKTALLYRIAWVDDLHRSGGGGGGGAAVVAAGQHPLPDSPAASGLGAGDAGGGGGARPVGGRSPFKFQRYFDGPLRMAEKGVIADGVPVAGGRGAGAPPAGTGAQAGVPLGPEAQATLARAQAQAQAQVEAQLLASSGSLGGPLVPHQLVPQHPATQLPPYGPQHRIGTQLQPHFGASEAMHAQHAQQQFSSVPDGATFAALPRVISAPAAVDSEGGAMGQQLYSGAGAGAASGPSGAVAAPDWQKQSMHPPPGNGVWMAF